MPIMIGGAGSEPSPTTGTGDWVRATSPTLVTPVLGVATGTSLALGGATIGTDLFSTTTLRVLSGGSVRGGAFSASVLYGFLNPSDALADTTSARNLTLDGVTGLKLRTGWRVTWHSGDPAGTSATSGLSEVSAGLLGVGTGAAGSVAGSLSLTNLIGSGYLKSGSYTVATVPSAASSGAGAHIYVSDEAGGATPAFSDATNWRRYADRAIIS